MSIEAVPYQVHQTDAVNAEAARNARLTRESMGLAALLGEGNTSIDELRARFWGGNPRVICSVYPLPLTATFNWGGITTYRIPAAEKGTVQLLKVGETFQWIRDTLNPESNRQVPAPISSNSAASSLVQYWAEGALGSGSGYTMGVRLLPATMDRPTPEFYNTLVREQDLYFNYLCTMADQYHVKAEYRMIADQHRAAAQWLGLTERPWYVATSQEGLKSCPGCGFRLNRNVLVCNNCKSVIPQLYFDLGMEPPADDIAVTKAYEALVAKTTRDERRRAEISRELYRLETMKMEDDGDEGEEEETKRPASRSRKR